MFYTKENNVLYLLTHILVILMNSTETLPLFTVKSLSFGFARQERLLSRI